MTGDDIREALKWSLLAAMIVAAWCGVAAVRKARADQGPSLRMHKRDITAAPSSSLCLGSAHHRRR